MQVPLPLMRYLLRSFSYRDYRLLWFHSAFLHTGRQMWEVIQGWLLLQLTNSPAVLGAAAALWRLPTFVVEPLGGILADRADRRKLLAVTMIPYVVMLPLLALSIQVGRIAAWQVFAVILIGGVFSALYRPSRQALLPNLVPRPELVNAVAWGNAVQFVGMGLGPLLGGLLLEAMGIAFAYYINALLYGAGILLLLWMRLPPMTLTTRPFWYSFAEGLRYLARERLILAIVVLQLFIDLFGQAYGTLMPVFARDEFRAGAQGLGLLLLMAALGSASGITIVAGLGHAARKGMLLLSSALVFSLLLFLFSQLRTFPMALALLVGIGVCYGLYNALTASLIQGLVADAFRGRVMSTASVIHMGAASLGNFLLGTVASLVGVRTALALATSLGAGVTLLLAATVPRLRRL